MTQLISLNIKDDNITYKSVQKLANLRKLCVYCNNRITVLTNINNLKIIGLDNNISCKSLSQLTNITKLTAPKNSIIKSDHDNGLFGNDNMAIEWK